MVGNKDKETIIGDATNTNGVRKIMKQNDIFTLTIGVQSNTDIDLKNERQTMSLMDKLYNKAQKLQDKMLSKEAFPDEFSIRKPLIPLFVSPPLPKIEAMRTLISCSYQASPESDIFFCNSTNFTSLQFKQCEIDVNYTYTVFNQLNQTTILKRLIDGSFNDVIDQSLLVSGESEVSFDRSAKIDICRNAEIIQQVVGIASLVNETNNVEFDNLPLARDEITYRTP